MSRFALVAFLKSAALLIALAVAFSPTTVFAAHIWSIPGIPAADTPHNERRAIVSIALDRTNELLAPAASSDERVTQHTPGLITVFRHRDDFSGGSEIQRVSLDGSPAKPQIVRIAGTGSEGVGGMGDSFDARFVALANVPRAKVSANGDVLFIERSYDRAWLRAVSHSSGLLYTICGSDRPTPGSYQQPLRPIAFAPAPSGAIYITALTSEYETQIFKASPTDNGYVINRLQVVNETNSFVSFSLQATIDMVARDDDKLILSAGPSYYRLFELDLKSSNEVVVKALQTQLPGQSSPFIDGYFGHLSLLPNKTLLLTSVDGIIAVRRGSVSEYVAGRFRGRLADGIPASFAQLAPSSVAAGVNGDFFVAHVHGIRYVDAQNGESPFGDLLSHALSDHTSGNKSAARWRLDALQKVACFTEWLKSSPKSTLARSVSGVSDSSVSLLEPAFEFPPELKSLIRTVNINSAAQTGQLKLRAQMALAAIEQNSEFEPLRVYLAQRTGINVIDKATDAVAVGQKW